MSDLQILWEQLLIEDDDLREEEGALVSRESQMQAESVEALDFISRFLDEEAEERRRREDLKEVAIQTDRILTPDEETLQLVSDLLSAVLDKCIKTREE